MADVCIPSQIVAMGLATHTNSPGQQHTRHTNSTPPCHLLSRTLQQHYLAAGCIALYPVLHFTVLTHCLTITTTSPAAASTIFHFTFKQFRLHLPLLTCSTACSTTYNPQLRSEADVEGTA